MNGQCQRLWPEMRPARAASPLDLANNENPLGASPAVRDALERSLSRLHRYPDDRGDALRDAIAEHQRLSPEQIILGNGSNELIELVARLTLRGGGRGITVDPSFVPYQRVIKRYGTGLVKVPLEQFCFDTQRLIDATDEQTRLLFIGSPNNPSGSIMTNEQLKALLDRTPGDVVVVLDHAYAEYLPGSERLDYRELLAIHPALLVLRSFSKAYGLASLRIGYGLGARALIERLYGERSTFNTNALAQVAAVAALRDQAHIERTRVENRRAMDRLTDALREHGIRFQPSLANFLMVEVGDGEAVTKALLEQGIRVKPLTRFGLAEWIRLSTATVAQMVWVTEQLVAAIHEHQRRGCHTARRVSKVR